MAKIAVRVNGERTEMSLGRAREAVAAGTATYVRAPKPKKKVAKKATKKVAKKATKAVATRNRSMRGRTTTK